MPSVGIDISSYQPNEVPGDWLFVVVKATEGRSYVNPKLSPQWAFASRYPIRGMYHYARPHVSDGASQARYFASVAKSHGFRPGIDIWQLDCEGELNGTVGGNEWRTFTIDFMETALRELGPRGFLYCGFYFYREQMGPLCDRYHWWLPDYGNNNGEVHALPPGRNPVIHQYSSAGHLDRNVIHDGARWLAIMGPPPPPPKPIPIATVRALKWLASVMRAVRVRPIQAGDTGRRVVLVQMRLRVHGYPIKPDGRYGPSTVRAVYAFKRVRYGHGYPRFLPKAAPRDGRSVGPWCLAALLRPPRPPRPKRR